MSSKYSVRWVKSTKATGIKRHAFIAIEGYAYPNNRARTFCGLDVYAHAPLADEVLSHRCDNCWLNLASFRRELEKQVGLLK